MTSNRLSVKRFHNMSNDSLRSSPTCTNTSRKLCNCRDRCRCSRFLWPAKGVYLQWVWLKKAWTWGMKFLTTSQARSTQTGAQWFLICLIKRFHFRSTSNSGTGLTSLIWSQMLLDQVLQYHHHHNCHPIHRHRSAELVRCHWIGLLMSVAFHQPILVMHKTQPL